MLFGKIRCLVTITRICKLMTRFLLHCRQQQLLSKCLMTQRLHQHVRSCRRAKKSVQIVFLLETALRHRLCELQEDGIHPSNSQNITPDPVPSSSQSSSTMTHPNPSMSEPAQKPLETGTRTPEEVPSTSQAHCRPMFRNWQQC